MFLCLSELQCPQLSNGDKTSCAQSTEYTAGHFLPGSPAPQNPVSATDCPALLGASGPPAAGAAGVRLVCTLAHWLAPWLALESRAA